MRYLPGGTSCGAPVVTRVSRLLGKGSFASAFALVQDLPDAGPDGRPGEAPVVAVLKCFRPPDPTLAMLFGPSFAREVEAQPAREKRVGEVLRGGPAHPGRRHVAQLLSAAPGLDGVDLAGPALVHEFAGLVLENAQGLRFVDCLHVVCQLLHAAAYLRIVGVVHADISPGNVCRDASGCARLIDWGSSVVF